MRTVRAVALVGLASLMAGGSFAQTSEASADGLSSRPTQVRVNFESVALPGDERMGLLGTSYLIEFGRGLSAGPAVYGAIAGQRGGLFTIGAELNWQRRLSGPLWLDLGYYAGGGGGGAAPVGGGLMLRPHADLLWDFGGFRAGLSLSQVRFANGQIDSRQLGLVASVPTNFRYVAADRLDAPVSGRAGTGLGFDRVQAVVAVLRPPSDARRTGGGSLPANIGLVGVRAEQALGKHVYWGVEAAGAASGGVAGYAEYLATLGAESGYWQGNLVLGARAAAGMGGGGEVPVGGGLLLKGSAYGIVRLSDVLGLTLEGGVMKAPQGELTAPFASASLLWVLEDRFDAGQSALATRTEWILGLERYEAARRDGSERNLDAVVLKINRFLSPHFYLTGQAHSALSGGAGGYSVGLFGLGVQTPLGARFHAGAELLAGAAGGGGVDTTGGFVVQPMAYVGWQATPAIALRLGAGKIATRQGPLDSPVVELSLAFTFGVASGGRP